MSKLSKSFKGQISRETEKAIEITVIKGDEMFSTWIPKSALNMKEMPVDCLSKEGLQIFHINQWFIDLKAKKAKEAPPKEEDVYETRTLSKDTRVDEITSLKPIGQNRNLKKEIIEKYIESQAVTVDMPFNPEAVTRSQGEFTTVLLEQILTATLRVGDLLEAMMKK